MLTRRNFLIASSVAGTVSLLRPALGAGSEQSAARTASLVATDKCTWTLVRPEGMTSADFQQYVLSDLAKAAGRLLPNSTSVWVTLQDPNEYSNAIVSVGGADRQVDAVLQVTSSDYYVGTEAVNAVLNANCGYVQGWRVHQTQIFDTSTPPPVVGKPLSLPHTIWFIERLDGETPEHFSKNWYRHGGHADGQEAESAQSRAYLTENRKHFEGHRYFQNRVVEPITPTAWVVHGYTDLTFAQFLPHVMEFEYELNKKVGEEHFLKWPPRLMQGRGYWVR
jgi:hypothetical protein